MATMLKTPADWPSSELLRAWDETISRTFHEAVTADQHGEGEHAREAFTRFHQLISVATNQAQRVQARIGGAR